MLMVKDKDLTNHPLVEALGAGIAAFGLAAIWVLIAGLVTAIATGDIHALFPQNLLNSILRALSSHP